MGRQIKEMKAREERENLDMAMAMETTTERHYTYIQVDMM